MTLPSGAMKSGVLDAIQIRFRAIDKHERTGTK